MKLQPAQGKKGGGVIVISRHAAPVSKPAVVISENAAVIPKRAASVSKTAVVLSKHEAVKSTSYYGCYTMV